MNIKLFLNEKLCVWLCFLLENFLFTNLLSHVILLIVDGFLLSTNRFQHLKKNILMISLKTRRQTPLLVLLFTGKWYFTWQLKWITCFEHVEGGEVAGSEVSKLDEYNTYYILAKRKGGDCLNLTECQRWALKMSTLNSTASTGIFSDVKCQYAYRNFCFDFK